jgi:large conductance mechanosensitive channel
MSIADEFKAFISGGNVIDLAVGVVIGAAFGKIVGLLTGGVDLAGMKIVLQAADEAAKKAEVAIGYGDVLAATLNFVIVGFVLFLVVKAYNRVKAPAPTPAAPAGPSQEELLAEIRDLLKKQS